MKFSWVSDIFEYRISNQKSSEPRPISSYGTSAASVIMSSFKFQLRWSHRWAKELLYVLIFNDNYSTWKGEFFVGKGRTIFADPRIAEFGIQTQLLFNLRTMHKDFSLKNYRDCIAFLIPRSPSTNGKYIRHTPRALHRSRKKRH